MLEFFSILDKQIFLKELEKTHQFSECICSFRATVLLKSLLLNMYINALFLKVNY